MIAEQKVRYVLDIHGMSAHHGVDICVSTGGTATDTLTDVLCGFFADAGLSYSINEPFLPVVQVQFGLTHPRQAPGHFNWSLHLIAATLTVTQGQPERCYTRSTGLLHACILRRVPEQVIYAQ